MSNRSVNFGEARLARAAAIVLPGASEIRLRRRVTTSNTRARGARLDDGGAVVMGRARRDARAGDLRGVRRAGRARGDDDARRRRVAGPRRSRGGGCAPPLPGRVLLQPPSHRVARRETPWIEQISWSPRAQIYHNFITPEECAHLIDLARPYMHEANVVDKETGKSVVSGVRTSTGHFLSRGQDPIVQRVEERMAAFAMVPVDHGEAIQILRYSDGQKYDPHFDYFPTPTTSSDRASASPPCSSTSRTSRRAGRRCSRRGPTSTASAPRRRWTPRRRNCSARTSPEVRARKLHVKPRRGDALLFWSTNLEGWEDETSLHGVSGDSGEKWTATKWMRAGPLGGRRRWR